MGHGVRKLPLILLHGRCMLLLLAVCTLLAARLSIPPRVYFPFEHTQAPRRPPEYARARVRHLAPVDASDKALRREEARKARLNALVDILVTRYARWHGRNRHNVNAPRLIWVGGGNTYGFGDRFRGLIHAYLCAVLTGRVLVIKWDTPFPLSLIFQAADIDAFFNPKFDGPDFIVCSYAEPTRDNRCVKKRDLSVLDAALPFAGLPNCYCSLRDMGMLWSDLRVVVVRSEAAPSVIRLFKACLNAPKQLPKISAPILPLAEAWKNNLMPPLATSDETALFPHIFRALFRPAQPLTHLLNAQSNVVRAFIPNHLGGPRVTHKHISVQVRLGIGLNETSKYKHRFASHNATLHQIAVCIARLAANEAERLDLPEPQRFFLATDTQDFVRPFEQELGKVSHNPVVVQAVPEEHKVHSNTMRTTSQKDKIRFLLTAADLFFLSAGESLVSLPSGFATLAGWFGGTTHRVVHVQQCIRTKSST